MTTTPDWDRESVAKLGLSPDSLRRLDRLGVRTIGQLRHLMMDELVERQNWMSADELRDRKFEASLTYAEIQAKLAALGLGSLVLGGQPVSVLGLSIRASNHANRAGVTTVGQLCELAEQDILEWGGFGETTLREVQEALSRVGLRLGLRPESRHG